MPAELEKQLAKLQDDIMHASADASEALLKRKELLEQQVKDADVKAIDFGYQEKKLADGRTLYTPLEELIRWRLWNRTGGGLMAELGSHQLDAAGIFCSSQRSDGKKALPLSVSAVGGRYIFPYDREVDDHVFCTYEFPAPSYNEKDPDLKHHKIGSPTRRSTATALAVTEKS